MRDDALDRLLSYHGLRYYLANSWFVRFRVWRVEVSETRPLGIRYSLTLHDDLNRRLLGFDNAHGVPQQVAHDHWHLFRRTKPSFPYVFQDADKLLVDFMTAVETACQQEGVELCFVEKVVESDDELEEGEDDEDKPKR